MYAIRSYYGFRALSGARRDRNGEDLQARWRDGVFQHVPGSRRYVITSYSIHYTKLYDICRMTKIMRRSMRTTSIRFTGSSRMKINQQNKSNTKEDAQHPLFYANLRDELLLPVQHTPQKRHLHLNRSRITSYNVCYTKLLRGAIGTSRPTILSGIYFRESV